MPGAACHPSTLPELPTDILLHIITYLTLPRDAVPLMRQCRRLATLLRPLVHAEMTFTSREQIDAFLLDYLNLPSKLVGAQDMTEILERVKSSGEGGEEGGVPQRASASRHGGFPVTLTLKKLHFTLRSSPLVLVHKNYDHSPAASPKDPTPLPSPLASRSSRFIDTPLLLASLACPNLTHLSLSGCHVSEHVFQQALRHLPHLEWVDMSYTSLKSMGLIAIAQHCRKRLRYLDVSGIFNLRRLHPYCLEAVVRGLRATLRTVVARDCADLDKEVVKEIVRLSESRFVQLHWTPPATLPGRVVSVA